MRFNKKKIKQKFYVKEICIQYKITIYTADEKTTLCPEIAPIYAVPYFFGMS